MKPPAGLAAWLLALAAGGCGTEEGMPALDPAVPESPASLEWVDPARCLSPCDYLPDATLVPVDDWGEPSAQGRHRIAGGALGPLRSLFAAARTAGHLLGINSAFRSYDEQARLFEQTNDPGRVARPGHSEHQLGTAVDLRLPTSAAIVWLADSAFRFGFALSYPPGKQKLTGYQTEPWHVRLVGGALAEELHRTGWSIEELFAAHPELGRSGPCDDCPLPASRSPCEDATGARRCEGAVLRWCFAGAQAAVSCVASGQRCDQAAGEADCR